MKTFHDFLQEMALKSYRTDFHREPHGEEGFLDVGGGKRDLGRQVTSFGNGGSPDISGYFSKKDRSVISHPRTMRELERRLAGSGYNFNILMLESAPRRLPVARVGSPLANYRVQAEEYIKENGLVTEGHITFVKNGTTGHVLTPWMILHTLGHAVADQCKSRMASYDSSIPKLVARIASIVDKDCAGKTNFDKKQECLNIAAGVFMFKSAGMGGIESSVHIPGEFFHELIAEYLWNSDHIRLRPPYDANSEIVDIVRDIEDRIKTCLDMCVGRVIYDYYD